MNPFRRPLQRYGHAEAAVTPYQRAAQVWDDRIGAARVQARNWRLIAFGLLGLAAGVVADDINVRGHRQIVPWVVEVDRLGNARASGPAEADYQPSDPQIANALARFTADWRGLSIDPIVVRQSWLEAYAFATDHGAAKVDPVRAGFLNAIQVYPWSDGALYQLYAAMLKVSDIALQEGEQLISVAAGDTARWTIGDTESGSGATRRVHILVKPTRGDLPANTLVINTDRRTYHLEAHAGGETAAYMAGVSWSYPADQLLALHRRNAAAEAAAPVDQGLSLDRLRFRYEISGDHPPWRPARAFDDGAKAYIEFPAGIGQGEMPPLFVVGPTGESELVNYRVSGHYMILDRLFGAAELRLGSDPQQVVRIARTDGRPRP